MERRLDAVKKQAEAIAELESEIAKAKKQEKSYEEAIEQLQSDLDALEQDNVKLKAMTAGTERQRTCSMAPHSDQLNLMKHVTAASTASQAPEAETVAVESSLETSHLLEQVRQRNACASFNPDSSCYL